MRYASRIAAAGLLVALTSATFVACKKEKEQNGPSISIPAETGVITGDLTLPPGTHSLRLKFIVQKGSGKDDADLKDHSFTANLGGANVPAFTNRPAPNGSSFTFDTTFSINGAAGNIYTYTFSVRDKNDKSASRSIKITFRDTSSSPPPSACNNPIDMSLGQDYTNQPDSSGSHLRYDTASTPILQVQNRTQANSNPAQILFVYYYSHTSGRHSIISPAILRDTIYNGFNVKWDNPNTRTTNFRWVHSSTIDFNNADCESIRNAFWRGTPVNDFSRNGDQRAECKNDTLIVFRQINNMYPDTIYGLVRVDRAVRNAAGATLSVKVVRPRRR